MSWLFSQALVEAYSGESCSDGEPFVQLNGNPTPQAYCAPDKMTKFSRLSRFGMTYAPLTADRGAELLTLYLAGFHAKTSVPQDMVQAFPAVDQDSGLKWQGLLGKYDHNMRLWKTAQCSLLEDLEQCLEIWPRWGLMRDGVSYQQQTLVHHTSENESGLWRTPGAQDGMRGTYASKETMDARLAKGGQLSLPNQMRHRHLWPTVTATANQLAPSMQSRYANPIFPTPTASDYTGAGHSAQGGKNLRTVVAENKWPTPRLNDYKGGAADDTQGREITDGSTVLQRGISRNWPIEPDVGRVANGVAARVDRLKAIGNGQVPRVAATAFKLLAGKF